MFYPEGAPPWCVPNWHYWNFQTVPPNVPEADEPDDPSDEGREVSGYRVGIRDCGDELVEADLVSLNDADLTFIDSASGSVVATFSSGSWISAVKTTWKEY